MRNMETFSDDPPEQYIGSAENREQLEQWARELSPETFGTEEERRDNFERLLDKLSEEKIKYGIQAEEFEKRLKEAKEFTKSMPLFHNTSIKGAMGIFNSDKIASNYTLRKEKGLWQKPFQSNTLAVDKRAGLDKMVFTSPLLIRGYGDVTLEVDGKILDRPDCVVTYEDIIITLERVCPSGRKPYTIFGYVKERFAMPKVLSEYKSQVISGKNFREFLSHYIAIYGIPEDYQKRQDEGHHSEELNSPSNEVVNVPSSYIKKWIIPEVKVRNEISAGNIKGVIVKDQSHADLLINNGVSKDLIKIVEFEAR